ncbi:MAG TPA: hypothetical protein VGK00_15065 [Anaerolineales bacterium]|jgi:hypothetical protein
MKRSPVIFSLLIIILLSACGQLTPVPRPPVETDHPVPATGLPDANPVTAEVLPTPVSGGGYPEVVWQVRARLAEKLNLPEEQVTVSNIVPMEWPDTCLGLGGLNESCGAQIIAGYQIILATGGVQYTFRTDGDGSNIRQDNAPLPVSTAEESRTLLEWKGPACERFLVNDKAAFYGKCGESLRVVSLFDSGLEPLKNWIKTFAPFEAETSAGRVTFGGLGPNTAGFGSSKATPADQRMLAEWAKLQFEAAQSGRTGAAWGLAFAYRREGGIAGFCDDVGVYLDGRVLASNCKGMNASLYLTSSEMQQVYDWYDGFKAIDRTYSDPTIADKMTTILVMPGRGNKKAGEPEIRGILEFISALDARAVFAQQAGPDAAAAEQALVDYFRALNSGDFMRGAKLYGGPTDLLQTWNPDIKNDLPAWLKRGCQQNGLVCLMPRSIRFHSQDVRGGYQFIVEFNQKGGTLFAQGPCCGETNGVVSTSFTFTVIPQAGGWQVMELPPYVP